MSFFSLFPQVPFSDACFENTETASFHGGITLASILVLKSLDRIARWKKTVNSSSSIRQQFRYVLPAFLQLQALYFILGIFYGLDIHTYPFVCSTLRFSSSCSSLSSPSGDRKLRETRLLPHTHTKCRWKVRSGIFWTMTSSTGHG
jgi:hypothetical protein